MHSILNTKDRDGNKKRCFWILAHGIKRHLLIPNGTMAHWTLNIFGMSEDISIGIGFWNNFSEKKFNVGHSVNEFNCLWNSSFKLVLFLPKNFFHKTSGKKSLYEIFHGNSQIPSWPTQNDNEMR